MPLPAESVAVCAYLTERAEEGVSLSTIDLACWAIGHQHRHHGLSDPIDDNVVRQVRRGLRRLIGVAPHRPTRTLSVADLRQIITSTDRSTSSGVRDTALILVGFAGALRLSELAQLTLADLEAKPGAYCCTCAAPGPTPNTAARASASRMDRIGSPTQSQPSTPGSHFRGTTPGPVFTSMRRTRPPLQPITANTVGTIVKDRARAAGSSAERILHTRCAPATPQRRPRRPRPASASNALLPRVLPRPDTGASTSSSSATSGPVQALQTTSSRDLDP